MAQFRKNYLLRWPLISFSSHSNFLSFGRLKLLKPIGRWSERVFSVMAYFLRDRFFPLRVVVMWGRWFALFFAHVRYILLIFASAITNIQFLLRCVVTVCALFNEKANGRAQKSHSCCRSDTYVALDPSGWYYCSIVILTYSFIFLVLLHLALPSMILFDSVL